MSDFSDKIRLKEKAEEDIYFARRNRELIKALHEKNQVERPENDTGSKDNQPGELQKDAAPSTRQPAYDRGNIAERCRKLIDKVLKFRP